MTKRDYAHEYKSYQGTPEQIKNRSERNKARRAVEKKVGDLPPNKDVDHKTPIRNGGGNTPSNLRVVDESKNSAWRKGKKKYD
jgi:5-methylcytosine-specific restriction endonuclease McrA